MVRNINIEKEECYRKEFRKLLLDLSFPQNLSVNSSNLKEIYSRFLSIYVPHSHEEHIRHFYSDVFSVLSEIKANQDTNDQNSIEILGSNIKIVRDSYEPPEDKRDSIEDELRKLYDHISLDIARMSYSDSADAELSGENSILEIKEEIKRIQENVKNIEESQEKFKTLKDDISDVGKKYERIQREYIAILGIFASVVLVFTGGIAFSTSVLNNINSASLYRLVFVALIIGLVLIDTLFALFYFIERLVRDDNAGRKINICPVIILNAILFSLLLITFIAWYTGFIEHRNETVPSEMTSTLYMEINNREQAMPFPDYFYQLFIFQKQVLIDPLYLVHIFCSDPKFMFDHKLC